MFKRRLQWFFAGIILGSAGFMGAVGIEDVYHLDGHILKPEAGLHFLYGFILTKTPNIIRNLYVFGRLSTPVNPLVRSLFWHIDDGEEPFALKKSVFAVVPPYWCGRLVALARFCPDEFAPKKALHYSSLIVRENQEPFQGEPTKDSVGAEYQAYCVAQTLRAVVNQAGASNEKVRCPKLWRKLSLLVDAMKRANGAYDKTFPLSLFLAFMCDVSLDRRPLCEFIKGFAKGAFLCKKNVLTAEGRKIFRSDTQVFNLFCSQKYPFDFYKNVPKDPSLEERIVARIQSEHLFIPTLKNFGSRHFADCVETGLLKLVGELLFSGQTKSFDLSILPQKTVDQEKCKQFISSFSAYDANDVDARFLWFKSLGNCKNATYAFSWNKVSVGLMPTESNILLALNQCMGTSAKDYEELGAQLSTPSRNVSFLVSPQGSSRRLIALSTLSAGGVKRTASLLLVKSLTENKSHAAILYGPTPSFLRALCIPVFGPAVAFLASPLEGSLKSRFLKNTSLKNKVEKLVSFAGVNEKINDFLLEDEEE